MSRRGLGRGLDALLPTGGAELEERGALREAEIGSIAPNPRQPRQSFEDEPIEKLAASMRALGVLQPLLVRESASGYELIAGERRLRAARRAGLSVVPVFVVETDEQGSLERALVENIHRENLNPIEEASAYRELLDEIGATQEALGEKIGRSRAAIANALRLLELPIDIQQMIVERRLTAAHGRLLLTLQGNPFQKRFARRIYQDGLTVREAEELARRYQSMSVTSNRGGRPAKPPEATEAQRRLADHLQTRVRVDMGTRKGKIVVDFATLDELERLVRVMTGESPGAKSTSVSPE
ncbi:MAG: ParB/RepB/Spo0J family partition protein [Actinomycetota bacterium]